jgi:hypothetical protein
MKLKDHTDDQLFRQEWMERSDGSIYDTIHIRRMVGDVIDGFAQPVGATIITPGGSYTKTFDDTNMFDAFILPPPNSMFVDEIKCLLTRDDVVVPIGDRWYRNIRFQFMINQKIYREGHLDTVADPSAMFVDEWERKNASEKNLYKLMRRTLSTPLLINVQETFQFRVFFHDALDLLNGPDKLRIYLDGFRYRAII